MIGAIDEAKKKAPPEKPVAKTESGGKPAVKGDQKPVGDSKSTAKTASPPKQELKSQQEGEHADDAHES
jgi:hypothetical protein